MKKILLILAIVTLMVNYNKAQDNKTDFRERLQFGAKIGTNYSNVYDSKGEEFSADGKFGFAFGGFVSIPIGKFIGIQPEVLYSQKGFQATGKILGLNYKFTRTLSYIDVPILFTMKPTEFISLLIGPQYSYLVKSKEVFATAITTIEQEQEFENDNIRKNTLCFLFGADINLKNIVLSGRAGWDLLNNIGDGSSTTPRYKNVWYQATIGFRL